LGSVVKFTGEAEVAKDQLMFDGGARGLKYSDANEIDGEACQVFIDGFEFPDDASVLANPILYDINCCF